MLGVERGIQEQIERKDKRLIWEKRCKIKTRKEKENKRYRGEKVMETRRERLKETGCNREYLEGIRISEENVAKQKRRRGIL